MKVKIDAADGEMIDAITFAETHVIVSRRDLNRVKRLAQRLGFYPQLKALGVSMQEINVTGPGTPRRGR